MYRCFKARRSLLIFLFSLITVLLLIPLAARGNAPETANHVMSSRLLQPPFASRFSDEKLHGSPVFLEMKATPLLRSLLTPQQSSYAQEGSPGSLTTRNELLIAIIIGSIFGFLILIACLVFCIRTFCPNCCANCCGTDDPCVRACIGKRKAASL